MVGIGSVLREVLDRGLQVIRVDEILPCGCPLWHFGGIVPEKLPKARAKPFVVGAFEIPVPDPVPVDEISYPIRIPRPVDGCKTFVFQQVKEFASSPARWASILQICGP